MVYFLGIKRVWATVLVGWNSEPLVVSQKLVCCVEANVAWS